MRRQLALFKVGLFDLDSTPGVVFMCLINYPTLHETQVYTCTHRQIPGGLFDRELGEVQVRHHATNVNDALLIQESD